MRDHTYNPFFIISAETKENDLTEELRDDLKHFGAKFAQIDGCYKGETEKAFIVYSNDIKKPLELREKYNQDSVLLRSCHNDCSLAYADKSEYIGSFKQVTQAEALKHDAYSIIDGLYYITE